MMIYFVSIFAFLERQIYLQNMLEMYCKLKIFFFLLQWVVLLNVLRCQLTYEGQAETNAEAWFNIALRPRKPEGSLGQTAQDGHLDSHTASELQFTSVSVQ